MLSSGKLFPSGLINLLIRHGNYSGYSCSNTNWLVTRVRSPGFADLAIQPGDGACNDAIGAIMCSNVSFDIVREGDARWRTSDDLVWSGRSQIGELEST